jgi:hypothetical protein
MAAHRSPNCPQITFLEAAEKGRRVYDKEHIHPAPKAAVAEDLGYSGINGRALSMIGALRQYGILEGSSEALRITEDAVAYYELEAGAEREESLMRMIFAPPFFASLRQEYGDSLPSESTLKHRLIRDGFLPRAADEVISVYKENISLVKDIPKRILESLDQAVAEPPVAARPNSILPETQSPSNIYSVSYVLSQDTTAQLRISGDVTEEDLELLRDNVELTIRGLKRGRKLGKQIHETPSSE